MPHLYLDHSSNLIEGYWPEELLGKLHDVLVRTGPFELERIKSRVVEQEEYRVADGDPENAFVHLRVEILEGRPEALRRHVAEKLLALLETEFERSRRERRCSISVEIREMNPMTYLTSRSEPS